MPEPIEVRKVSIGHVSDASGLADLIDAGILDADRVVAVIGKTEGNGGVNDYTRIIADRSTGALFFGIYYLMDYELMGGDARAAIIAETGKRGMKPFLPPLVPFGSKQWPALVTPGPGPATIADPWSSRIRTSPETTRWDDAT